MDRTPPKWFVDELKLISPDLRIIWGRESFGCHLWLIQHKQPDDIYGKLLEEFEREHKERFIDQTLVNDDGDKIGERLRDVFPQWMTIHFVENPGTNRDLPESYREPDRRDIQVMQEWNRNATEKFREMRDAITRDKEKQQQETEYGRKHAIKAAKARWRGDVFCDIDKDKILEGTEV